MRIIVQKFGGTSISTPERRAKVIDKVRRAVDQGWTPVLVVSAMGRKGDPYATDTLLSLVEKPGHEPTAADTDLLLSCGEIIGSVVIASMLCARGMAARAVTGAQAGIITDDVHGRAQCLRMEPARLFTMLEKGIIPVVAGFQGVTEAGDITTLGRGGSDTTACIVGRGLRAERVEIFTDVDGIMTADPRIVPQARLLSDISYMEVFQMAGHGAKVIHPAAVEIAMEGNIPLVVRSTTGDGEGTTISAAPGGPGGLPHKVITSIAHLSDRVQAVVDDVDAGRSTAVLSELAAHGVSIDLINIFPSRMVFTIDARQQPALERCLKQGGHRYTLRENCCKISAIGIRMRGVPGVMSRILQALNDAGVPVLQTADSHMSISCLVPGDCAGTAVQALHSAFGLDE